MKNLIHIVFLLAGLTAVLAQLPGQQTTNLPVACGGTMVRYKVSGIKGSTFEWKLPKKATVLANYNDSIDVSWKKDSLFRSFSIVDSMVVTEYTNFNCIGSPAISYLKIAHPGTVYLAEKFWVCENSTVELGPKTSYAAYLWSIPDTSRTDLNQRRIIVSKSGTYYLTVFDADGCGETASTVVDVRPNPVISLGNDTTLCRNKPLVLTPGAGFYRYTWSTGDISQSISVGDGEQVIWVKVEDENSCVGIDTIKIKKCPFSKIADIPNSFTPNGDGDNDTWCIPHIDNYPGAVVQIFDNWGRMVYQAKGNFNCWDGYSKGRPLPMDSYYYIIDLKDGSSQIVGNITIIR